MVNGIEGPWNFKENTNSIITIFYSLYNLIYEKDLQTNHGNNNNAILRRCNDWLKNHHTGIYYPSDKTGIIALN